jgi:flagellar hook-basal body complex protein FliE
MPIDPVTMPLLGPEFSVPGIDPATSSTSSTGAVEGAGEGKGFGALLKGELQKLGELQTQAATQSEALATGRAGDVTSVVMAVERAALGMQLATQVRNKAVEAYQEIFRMHI